MKKTTTDFWNDLMREMWENETGYSFTHFDKAMQEYASQQTAAIAAERNEYRKELETVVRRTMNITPYEIISDIKDLLEKYPQQ